MTDQIPQAPDAERALLGAILLRPAILDDVAGVVQPEHLWVPAHGAILEAMLAVAAAGTALDPVALDAALTAAGRDRVSGGLPYLGELQAGVPTAENAGYYARLVRGAADLRAAVGVCAEAANAASRARPAEAREVLDEIEQQVLAVTAGARVGADSMRDASVVATETYAAVAARQDAPDRPTGVETGYAEVDLLLSGLQPGELILLAGRPGTGKTTLAANVVLAACVRRGAPALVFSLETSAATLAERMSCAYSGVPADRARRGRLTADDWSAWIEAANALGRAPLTFDDSADPTILDVRARGRRFRRRYRDAALGLIVVDYLQLVRPVRRAGRRDTTREQEVAEVSRGLKALARETAWPVLALSQLRRQEVDTVKPRIPRLSDLRESGALEQDADVVAFLHTRDGEDVDLIIAKQRNGPVGTAPLRFERARAAFRSRNAGANPPATGEENF